MLRDAITRLEGELAAARAALAERDRAIAQLQASRGEGGGRVRQTRGWYALPLVRVQHTPAACMESVLQSCCTTLPHTCRPAAQEEGRHLERKVIKVG